MERKSEWYVGAESAGFGIWFRLKGYIDNRFSHTFLSLKDAEQMANDILKVTKEIKANSIGKCIQCGRYIINEDAYYEIKDKVFLHKQNCVGEFLEKNIIDKKLIAKKAPKVDTTKIVIGHEI